MVSALLEGTEKIKSLEITLTLPLLKRVFDQTRNKPWNSSVFFDWGSGKNHDDAIAQGKDTIYSAGVGISYQGLKGLTADVFYAHAFKDFKVTEKDLQDEGFHFRLRYNYAF